VKLKINSLLKICEVNISKKIFTYTQYIACFWIKNSNFGRFVFQICHTKKERKTHKNKDYKRVLCSCKYKARHA
jgi:hypothetical protein